jgi:hypothetical protein
MEDAQNHRVQMGTRNSDLDLPLTENLESPVGKAKKIVKVKDLVGGLQ